MDTRDALGRATAYIEYSSAGVTAFSSTTAYNDDNLETSETDNTVESSGATVSTTTTYDYDLLSGTTYTGAYEGGQVVHTHTTSTTTSGTAPASTDTVNTYGWGTMSYETAIAYTPNTASPGTVYHSTFYYDANGHLSSVYIADGDPRTVSYITSATGQVMMRTVASGASTNPSEEYYYFNGIQIADIGHRGAAPGQAASLSSPGPQP